MKLINPANMPSVARGYSHAVAAGPFVFVAGQLSVDAAGELVGPGDVVAQTRQVLDNVAAVLASEGLGLSDVVNTTVYLKHIEDYAAYAQAYIDGFAGHEPARATVLADLVRPEFLVEVQAIAVRRDAEATR